MKIKKMTALLTAGVLCASLFAGCGNSGSGDSDKLIVGLDPAFPPMGFKDESGTIQGFDIDLANEVGEKLGVKMEFQPIDWDSKEVELDTGKIDMIWNGFTKTPEREEGMTLTKAYLKNAQVVVVPTDSSIGSKEDLAGKKVCLQKESTAKDAFDESGLGDQVASLTELANNVDCFMSIEQGTDEAMIVDEVVAKYYLAQDNNKEKFKIVGDKLTDEEYVIAMKKGNDELKEKIEAAITELKEEGKTKELSEKWFGEDIFYWE